MSVCERLAYPRTKSSRVIAELEADKFEPILRYVAAPANRVFVVYISPNEMLSQFPDVYGWAEHWAWVAADPSLKGAPIDWETRYDEKIWSSSENG